MKNLIALLTVLTISFITLGANAKTDDIHLSLLSGHVELLGDQKDKGASKLGWGVNLAYMTSHDSFVEAQLTQASQTLLQHTNVSVGLGWYLADLGDIYPYLSLGAVYSNNTVDYTTETVEDTVFGGYGAFGFDAKIRKRLIVGVQGKYNTVFSKEVQLSTGEKVQVVDDTFSVMLKIGVQF